MPVSSSSTLIRLRTAWWAIHRWIALLLCILLVPIAISGALLVWHDELEPLLHPTRFAVTGNHDTRVGLGKIRAGISSAGFQNIDNAGAWLELDGGIVSPHRRCRVPPGCERLPRVC